jgi:hypothetical protein
LIILVLDNIKPIVYYTLMSKKKLLTLSVTLYAIFVLTVLSVAPYVLATENKNNESKIERNEKEEKDNKNKSEEKKEEKENKEKVDNEKIGVCHATSSKTNPFVYIWVSINSIINGKGHNKDHHTHDIYPVKSKEECIKAAVSTPSPVPTASPKASSAPSSTPKPSSTPEPKKGDTLGDKKEDPKVIATVASDVTSLPKTGLPLLGLLFIALAPAGLRMRRSAKVEKALDSAHNIWSSRELKK